MRIHLDHAATTPVRPEVSDILADLHGRALGNPSSLHHSGRHARRLLDDARDEIAGLIGMRPSEIVFTSGGTEADDLAVNGVASANRGKVLCSAVEHEAVREAVVHLGERGRLIGVDTAGRCTPADLEEALGHDLHDDGVALVSVMLVNNENGVRQDLDALADVIDDRAPGTLLHTDAVQGAAWMDLESATRRADLVSISGHKIGAPVGIGVLGVRDHVRLAARLRGGGQERARRSGTQNVVGAVALATALRLADANRASTLARVAALRDRLADAVIHACEGVIEPANPPGTNRSTMVGGSVQLCILGVESEVLLFALDEAGIDASAGSACAAGALETSHVLAAMGVDDDLAKGALRLSVGTTTTGSEVELAIPIIIECIDRLRSARAA